MLCSSTWRQLFGCAKCSQSYANGTSVTLVATPTAGSIFAGWGGNCTGTGTCALDMNAAKGVTANFISTSPTSGADCLFDWAERILPQYFAPVGAVSTISPPYSYRYYSGKSNFLAISSADNHIWVRGPSTGNGLVDVGSTTGFLAAAGRSSQGEARSSENVQR